MSSAPPPESDATGSSVPGPERDESPDEARARRARALQDLATGRPDAQREVGAGSSAAPGRAGLGRRRAPVAGRRPVWWLALVAVVVIAAIVAGLVVRLRPHGTTTMPPAHAAAVRVLPALIGLHCPIDLAWSPDSTRVAILGYAACPDSGGTARATAGLVVVYDARTGKSLASIQLDAALQGAHLTPAPGSTPTAQGTAYIAYQAVLWSSDGTHLALPFFVEPGFFELGLPFLAGQGTPLPTTPTTAGVLLTDATGGAPRVVTAPYRQRLDRLEWDLTTGTLLSGALALPPALGFQWGNNGALVPQTPLNTTAAPSAPAPGPVGQPAGGASFTIWQPGLAAPGYTRSGSGGITSVANVSLWESAFAAWSPDGRYLLTPAYAGGRVALAGQPAPTADALAVTGTAHAPILPARDTALARLYTAMVPDASGAPPDVQSVAWRPDGRTLAATGVPYFSQDAASLAARTTVALYDTATGRALTTLKPAVDLAHALGAPQTGQVVWLAWSPDGSHLLLLSDLIGTLTIWGPDALPH